MAARRILCLTMHIRALSWSCCFLASALFLFSRLVHAEADVLMLVQNSPLAGSQYHALESLYERVRVGDKLTLVREPENPHDPNAVRVEWQGELLGYVPRRENRAVAKAMDTGETLSARITALQKHDNPWLRLRFAVFLRL